MATGKQCCDRSVFARTLEVMLQNLVKSMEGLNSMVTEHAEEMGLDSLGVFDEQPKDVPVLRFPLNSQMRIEWDEVDTQLAGIGKITGMYTVPRNLLMGIRGKDGDILIRLIDVQQRRLHGVLQYFQDTPIIPSWFKVGARACFHGSGPVAEVVSIDSTNSSWTASEDGDERIYPLNEVAEHWDPV
jgi:hypothetical protein